MNTVTKLEPETPVPETVRHYLARAGMNRDYTRFDHEAKAWRYPVDLRGYEDETQEKVDHYAKMLPLVVPGLKVVDARLDRWRENALRGSIWFTWNRDAMWARIREIFDEYGVADERIAYRECSGEVYMPDGQHNLPGVLEIEPYATENTLGFTSYTPGALQQIDSGFCQRIKDPNKGGPDAEMFNRSCVVGNEWWLVATRGDSAEVLTLEIQGSPLDAQTKENLLYNLKEWPR